jgi:hypothetical protein
MKHIRPLTAYKKANPDFYHFCWENDDLNDSKSKKGKENLGYWIYCWIKLDKSSKEGKPNPFFWNTAKSKNNLSTISEMGRLLLTAWYYNIEEWAMNVCGYVYNSYNKKDNSFNDLEFAKVVKHIRENIGFYLHNEQQLKLYIVESLFNDELQPLLPEKPKELKEYESGVEVMKELEKTWTKKDKDAFRKRMWNLDSYTGYLSDLLDQHGISYLELGEFLRGEQKENREYIDRLNQLYQEYQQSILNVDSSKLLT